MADSSSANALVLSVSADTSKALKELEKLNKKLDALNDNAERTGKKTKKSLDGLFGKPGQALDKIFDSTRFKVLDTGAARVGLFGSSLEKLGVAGLGAAAGIGALAFALNQADKALAFTDELEDTANRLHITTDALQEYRYAIRAAGGDEKGADEALESFSSTLGKAQAGLPKAIRAFKELGFTDAQIKGFADTQSALDTVIGKISQLKSPAQKDAIVDQLGLTGIKELAQGGAAEVARLREEAHKAGVVFDAELIRKASGLHDEIETINARIGIDMKAAFVGLGPVLLDLKKSLAGMLETVLAILDAFKKVGDRSEITLRNDAATSQAQINSIVKQQAGGDKSASLNTALANARSSLAAANAALNAKAAATSAALKDQDAKNQRGGTGSLISQAKASGPSAQSQQKHFDSALAKIQDAILAASDDDLHSLQERQAIAQARLKLESETARTAILDDVQTKAITGKQGEILLGKQAEAAAAKKTQLDAQQAQALRDLRLKQEQELVSAVASLLDAQLGLTRSAEERGRLEAQILAAQRALARKLLIEAQNADPDKSPTHQAQQRVEVVAFDATTAALERAQARKKAKDVAEEALGVAEASLDAQIATQQLNGQLAETAAGRREAELKLLDLQYQEQAARLKVIIATSDNAAEIEKATTALKSLNDNKAGQRQGVINNTRGPLEEFAAGLPTDAAKMNEALEKVSTHGLQSLEDGLVGVITHTQKLGDVFRDVANQIIADLARIAIEKAIIGPLENVLSGGLGNIGKGIGNLFGGHRAAGGPVTAGRAYLVGERGPEIMVPSVSGSIVPNGSIKAVASMSGQGGGVTVVQPIHLDLRGAVMTNDLLAQVNQIAGQKAAMAAQHGAALALRGVPGRLASYQQQSCG